MRNKIDYGIDLGTTNSAIARMENGVPKIIKADTSKDIVPSCVRFTPKKTVIVGELAVSAMQNDLTRALATFEPMKNNAFIEFKRTMGTTTTYTSSNMGKDYSSEELSAEVLKSLKSLVLDDTISSIVITVPAKFLNPQKEATIRAAKLAGFKQVQLLQEPVAAAIAYGLGSQSKDGFWLVFDFGGGTFDAALVKSEEGILLVKDTEGDNWLGGKNLDYAIVDEFIIPYLNKNYALDSVLEDTRKKQMLRDVLKRYAEIAKNQMSFKAEWFISVELGVLPIKDDNNEEIEIDITITQQDIERVLSPVFQKSIDITKELLQRNNLKGSDLGALILVGGPTHSPVLRRMLKEQITENVDTSANPMTVVAEGAALFASTVSEEVIDTPRDPSKIQLDVKYNATSVDTQEMVNIKVLRDKTTGLFPAKIYVETVRADGAWLSGKKTIGEKPELIEVLLLEGCSNSFTINVYDDLGNKLECQPNQFSILQGIGGLEDMSILPYNIGIERWFETEEKDLFQPVEGLEKNKRMPATGKISGLKTRKTLRPGVAEDIISIPVYQGAYNTAGTNPVLNNKVTEVIISGENMPVLLPKGSEVDITIKVDRNEQMLFKAYFPAIDHTEELKIQIKQTEPPTEDFLSSEIAKAKRRARTVNAIDIVEKLEKLEQQLENEKGDNDGKMKIWNGIRKELLKLDEAEKAVSWPKIEKELKDNFYEFEDLIRKIKESGYEENLNMDTLEAHADEYKRNINQIIRDKDLKRAKELNDDIEGLRIELTNAITKGQIDVNRIRYHDREFNSLRWRDANKARALVNQGLKLIAEGRTDQLRPVLFQIWDLRIDKDDDGTTLE
jgi:molecular chaperone DnaK